MAARTDSRIDAARSCRIRLDGRDALVVAAALALFAVMARGFWPHLSDDAFIAFRYAAQLLRGNGLVFNPGEFVEGYTSFTMVLVSAGWLAAGAGDVLFAAKVWGVCFAGATLVLTGVAGRIHFQERWAVAIAPLLLAVSPAFAINALNGLETSTFTFAMTLAYVLVLLDSPRRDVPFGLCLALAALTRPEGAYHFLVLFGVHAARRTPLRRLVHIGSAFSAVVVPFLCWKLAYYGALLPNTYYAKPGSERWGLYYVWDFVTSAGPFAAVPVLLVLGGLLVKGTSQGWRLAFLASHLSAVVISGGDWMLGWRFLVPALPVFYLAAAAGVVGLVRLVPSRPRWGAAGALVCAALLALAVLQPRARILAHCLGASRGLQEGHLEVARWIGQRARPGDAVALTDIGMIGYLTGLRVIDISGLTDAHIARSPGRMMQKRYDPAYVLDRAPRFVALVSWRVDPASGEPVPDSLWFQDAQLYEHASFAEHYDFTFSRYVHTMGYLSLYTRKPPPGSDVR